MSECFTIAKEYLALLLQQKCFRAEIAGSLRRGEYYTHDVDIVCADPSLSLNKERIEKSQQNNCNIEVYSANPKHFGAMLFMYTGPSGYQIGYRRKAQQQGMRLNQYGLWRGNELVASETEEEIYHALGKEYKVPELRGK